MGSLSLKLVLSPRYLYLKRKSLLPFCCNTLKGWLNSRGFSRQQENSVKYQKEYWAGELLKSGTEAGAHCAYRFDAPDCQDSRLGDYEKIIKEYLLPNINGARVLEIGCLGGKWSKYFFGRASEVTLVDLDGRVGEFLRRQFLKEKFGFYVTKGYELYGIADKSIDFIFSMDSLGRCPKKYLKSYLREFARVLDKDGKVLVHLPCVESPMSVEKNFVKLSKKEIEAACRKNGWSRFELDFNTIKHGVLLKVNLS